MDNFFMSMNAFVTEHEFYVKASIAAVLFLGAWSEARDRQRFYAGLFIFVALGLVFTLPNPPAELASLRLPF